MMTCSADPVLKWGSTAASMNLNLGWTWRIRSGWDGMGESFFDELTPGQHAVVCFSLMHGAGDFASFGAYTPRVVPHALKAIATVGAAEYAHALQQAIEAFPGKQLPI